MTDWVPLVDVSDMTLTDLLAVADGPILAATRRVVDELADENAVMVAGFSSAV